MKRAIAWFSIHSGAFIALASALGIFAHAVAPEFAEATGDAGFKIAAGIGIIGSIATAYAKGAGETNGK